MTKKISQLSALTTPADDDEIVINDTSTGVTKRMKRSDFFGGLVPPGVISGYIASSAPTGYLLCNGQEVSRSTYATLYAVIGTAYGTGNGTTTFNVPNLKGKVPVGYNSAETEFDNLGETSGEKTHVLTVAELASHGHGYTDPSHGHGIGDPGHSHGVSRDVAQTYGGNQRLQINGGGQAFNFGGSPIAAAGTGIFAYNATTGITISTTGSDAAHNNLQPYLVINYIIKY